MVPSTPKNELPDDDAVERMAKELLHDEFLAQDTAPKEAGGLSWIRSTLQSGGDSDD
ncbi:MAG: hypothetical protein ACI8X5_004260 [Planctomycetota bacterium]|jgi:hypothetical protein